MSARLKSLWAGRLPIADAFWNYAIFWGLLVNFAAHGLPLVLLLLRYAAGVEVGITATQAWLVSNLAPLPYNVLVLVGVWRSAGRFGSSKASVLGVRVAVVAWTALMVLV